MYEHILAPLDGSTLSECALSHAVALAETLNARITVLRVAERVPDPDISAAIDPVEWRLYTAEARAYVQEVAEKVRERGVEVQAELLEGDPAERIVDYAVEQSVDLIVISTHGQSGLSGWNVSSVVQKVILKAPAPVMIVRAYICERLALTSLRYGRVLVPLDGSRRAEYVLPLATALTRDQGSVLILAHVAPRPEAPRTRPLTSDESELVERLAELNREAAAEYLEEVRSRLPPNVEKRLLISDDAAAALHELVESDDIDLVLLCAHGYTGDSQWPYGSLALNFIVYGAVPLLIVQDIPPDEMEPSVAEELASEEKGH